MSNDGDSKLSRYELRENQLNIVSGGSPLQQVVQLWNVGAAAAPEPRTIELNDFSFSIESPPQIS
jgi:hypothetical protein